jgi:hypothetical protein
MNGYVRFYCAMSSGLSDGATCRYNCLQAKVGSICVFDDRRLNANNLEQPCGGVSGTLDLNEWNGME